jgi:hypothetical protein
VLKSSRHVHNSIDETFPCYIKADGVCGPPPELNLEKSRLGKASDGLLLWYTILRKYRMPQMHMSEQEYNHTLVRKIQNHV